MKLTWESAGGVALIAKLGNVTIGMIVPLAADPGTWVYQVDGVRVKWIAKAYGQVKGQPSARRAVERAWRAWCEHAGLI